MNLIAQPPSSEAECLFGWRSDSADGSLLSRGQGAGRATMKRLAGTSGWRGWALDGPRTPATKPSEIFAHNHQLAGPLKFVRNGSRSVICRADLPVEVLDAPAEFDVTTGRSSSPLIGWGEMISAISRGKTCETEHPLPTDQIVADLERNGWVASVDGEAVQVTLTLPQMFHQVTIQRDRSSGTRLGCELVDLTGFSPLCRRAAIELAHAANDRLQLVRYATTGPAGQLLFAEVHLSNARIPGIWLEMALEAIGTAIALSARELAALRDSGLAELTVDWLLAQSRKEDL